MTTRQVKIRCRCYWNGGRCSNDATQEDGLCDWCTVPGARHDDALRNNPSVILDRDGNVLGLGGDVQQHVDSLCHPDACWLPNSGRQLLRGPS